MSKVGSRRPRFRFMCRFLSAVFSFKWNLALISFFIFCLLNLPVPMEQQLTPEIVGAVLLLWITTVVLFTGIHFFMIEVMRTRPYYAQWFIIRGWFAILYAMPFAYLNMGEYIPLLVFQLTSHVIIFNPLLNKLRDVKYQHSLGIVGGGAARYPFWYLGKSSGWIDKIFLKLGPNAYKFFYFGCGGLMILSIIVIFNRYVN